MIFTSLSGTAMQLPHSHLVSYSHHGSPPPPPQPQAPPSSCRPQPRSNAHECPQDIPYDLKYIPHRIDLANQPATQRRRDLGHPRQAFSVQLPNAFATLQQRRECFSLPGSLSYPLRSFFPHTPSQPAYHLPSDTCSLLGTRSICTVYCACKVLTLVSFNWAYRKE